MTTLFILKALEDFYLYYDEPLKSTFQALRTIILSFDDEITEHWKYKLPFFYYRNKPFCYLWKDKKTQHPYIGVVKGMFIEHPMLHQGDRKKMKVFNINPNEDIPIESLREVLLEAQTFY